MSELNGSIDFAFALSCFFSLFAHRTIALTCPPRGSVGAVATGYLCRFAASSFLLQVYRVNWETKCTPRRGDTGG